MFLPFILSILEFKFVNHSCHGPIFCSKNPDNYFAYCLGRFLLNLFSFVILTILNDMPGKKVKQLAKKFDCD